MRVNPSGPVAGGCAVHQQGSIPARSQTSFDGRPAAADAKGPDLMGFVNACLRGRRRVGWEYIYHLFEVIGFHRLPSSEVCRLYEGLISDFECNRGGWQVGVGTEEKINVLREVLDWERWERERTPTDYPAGGDKADILEYVSKGAVDGIHFPRAEVLARLSRPTKNELARRGRLALQKFFMQRMDRLVKKLEQMDLPLSPQDPIWFRRTEETADVESLERDFLISFPGGEPLFVNHTIEGGTVDYPFAIREGVHGEAWARAQLKAGYILAEAIRDVGREDAEDAHQNFREILELFAERPIEDQAYIKVVWDGIMAIARAGAKMTANHVFDPRTGRQLLPWEVIEEGIRHGLIDQAARFPAQTSAFAMAGPNTDKTVEWVDRADRVVLTWSDDIRSAHSRTREKRSAGVVFPNKGGYFGQTCPMAPDDVLFGDLPDEEPIRQIFVLRRLAEVYVDLARRIYQQE